MGYVSSLEGKRSNLILVAGYNCCLVAYGQTGTGSGALREAATAMRDGGSGILLENNESF